MHIELTTHESDYLKHVLDAARKSLMHEIHHAQSHEFKEALRLQLELNEKLVEKVQGTLVAR